MSLKVLHNNEIPRDLWQRFIEQNSFSTPFQSPEYFDFYNSVKNLKAYALAIIDNGELVALAVISLQKEHGLKGFISKRAIIYGGPLIKEGFDLALKKMIQVILKELKRKAIYVEIRNLNDYSEYKSLFLQEGWQYRQYLNFKVSCVNEAIIWNNMNRLRKRQVKKALKNNVVTCEAKSMNEVEELYKILHTTYKKKIRKPLFEWSFFRNIYNSNFCKVFLVKKKDEIIGGHFCLIDNDVIYDWYGCGLDTNNKDFAPSTMLVYVALQYGARHNMKYFDFMGAGTPDKDYGVRDFKAQFGGELVEYGRFIMVLNPFMYKVGTFGIKLISKLK